MDERLRKALTNVTERQSGRNIIDADRVDSASVAGDTATIVLTPPVAGNVDFETLRPLVETAVTAIKGINRARVIMTAHREQPKKHAHAHPPKPAAKAVKKPARRIIAVASGKGGVGKSTVAANLAVALARDGMKVGLLDADIYGPSAPRLFGITDAPGLRKNDAGVQPITAHGVKLVSIGFVIKPGAPVVWRGPMVQGAIRQFMTDTDWGELDVLILDMPPGTGDAQLAIAQDLPVDGAVIVSTPQDLALDDARKAIGMFEQTHIPILGIVENMSSFICPHCGENSDIFGHGGAKDEAERLGVAFLGEIPLHPQLRTSSDEGNPAALGDSPVARAFLKAAKAALEAAELASKPAPEILFG
ncbi:Mrp/NBP35 family ATP-binding protein [uncultured Maricaulis sp.]|uniref:Mrp/NBP35 family ATP-binding protein n=1 Tax=uncultured Maricaulis sp. TaxID=174710 RepID=UPI0030DB6C27|tara:strand:- start:8656 stop:9738 length:1083 start_codon:yes stop_codon:yes gene_type:complete